MRSDENVAKRTLERYLRSTSSCLWLKSIPASQGDSECPCLRRSQGSISAGTSIQINTFDGPVRSQLDVYRLFSYCLQQACNLLHIRKTISVRPTSFIQNLLKAGNFYHLCPQSRSKGSPGNQSVRMQRSPVSLTVDRSHTSGRAIPQHHFATSQFHTLCPAEPY